MLVVPEVLKHMRDEGIDTDKVPVVVGGVIPDDDAKELMKLGVARVYTPRDHDVTKIIGEIAELVQ